MLKINIFILCIIFVCACSQSTSPVTYKLDANFTLTDTLGQIATQFHPLDEFQLSFSLTNDTKETLTYYRGNSGPSVILRIQKNDSVISSSIDGYDFLAVVLNGRLDPGHSIDENWLAPTTPAQYPKVILSPGEYKATASYPNFNEADVDSVAPIFFTIVE